MRGKFKQAEEALLLVNNDLYRADLCYVACLCKCFIMNGKPEKAWNRYSKVKNNDESMYVAQLIANECYRMGQFFYAAKAFDVLDKYDSKQNFWEGKRGACVGVFQEVVAMKHKKEKDFKSSLCSRQIKEIIRLLDNSGNHEAEYIQNKIKVWSMANGLNVLS